ncbi:MAG: DUF3311 domain-containing protein [Bryobacteraceae bacterium]
MKRVSLTVLVIFVYIAHQDWWNWTKAEPLYFGFLPIGLFYHVMYTLAASVLMAVLVRYAWPAWLEEEVDRRLAANPKDPSA